MDSRRVTVAWEMIKGDVEEREAECMRSARVMQRERMRGGVQYGESKVAAIIQLLGCW